MSAWSAWDDDIDIGIMFGDVERLQGMEAALREKSITIDELDGHFFRLRRVGASDEFIDVFPFRARKGEPGIAEHASDLGRSLWLSSTYALGEDGRPDTSSRLPFDFYTENGERRRLTVPAPSDAENFLAVTYGDDWRTPIPETRHNFVAVTKPYAIGVSVASLISLLVIGGRSLYLR